jgi:two-component system chemotaxis sensor kinase CheA
VEIVSTEGAGTTMRIRLPLTLAIIDGFLVSVARQSYVLPLDMIVECVELRPEDQTDPAAKDTRPKRQQDGDRSFVNLRGEVLPYLRLRDVFCLNSEQVTRRENVVVVQHAGDKAGLLVDELLGEFQTVIKPMGKIFQGLRGISGSTVLGSGEVALILDVQSLVQQAVRAEASFVGGPTSGTALRRAGATP